MAMEMSSKVIDLTRSLLDLALTVYKAMPPSSSEKEASLKDDLNFISNELEMMGSFLMDAANNRRAHRNNLSKTWVRKVRDLVYDMEDCFQDLIIQHEKPRRSSSKPQPTEMVADKVRTLRKRIEEINQCYNNIKDWCPSSASATGGVYHRQKIPDSFASKQSLLVGREIEKSHIIQMVSKNSKTLQIIPIWGMGGLGKTAVVRSIYENQDISGNFQKYAWITLSPPFSAEEFFRSLILQLQEADMTRKEILKKMDINDLIEESNTLLKARSYLIVLDNVSSIAEWKFLMQHIPKEENASRIIVTTREKSVAEHCSMHNIYKLEPLKDDAALQLFGKMLTEPADFDGRLEMVEQAKCILQKCNGLPLAITNVCGLLATRPKTAPEWKRFNENFSSELESNPSLEMIRTVLTSNCEELPYHLILCFLYLSLFPKDQSIRRKRLVRRWIAEGYSSGTHNMSAEENGEGYFADLISRSIIQPSESVAGSGVSTDCCHIHNLLHEISVSKSIEEKFSLVLHNRSYLETKDKIRHLSISSSWNRDANKMKNMGDMSQLRSLTISGDWKPFLTEGDLRMLRVLDLESINGLLDHHIEPMTKFLHLKYFSLRGCASIFCLPDSLGNLWDLQTLDVRGTSIIKLPKTIVKLKKLQYLRAGQIPEDEEPRDYAGPTDNDDDDMPEALNTTMKWTAATAVLVTSMILPRVIDNDANRKDTYNMICKNVFPSLAWGLDMHGVKIPKGIGNLNSLETLGVVNVGARKAASVELELGNLSKLRKLGVTGLKRENNMHFFSAIAKLTLLQSLSIRSEGKPGLEDCLDVKSSSPPIDLRSLKLYGNLVMLPPWISRLQNLAKLKLRSTRLGQDAIPVLGSMPHLAILRLLCYSIQGEGLHFQFQPGSFPNLVLLQLDGLPDLQSLEFEQGTTPNLELLQVENCTDIEKHGWSGLSFLPSLKEVSLKASHGYSNKFMQDLRWQLAENLNGPILKEN